MRNKSSCCNKPVVRGSHGKPVCYQCWNRQASVFASPSIARVILDDIPYGAAIPKSPGRPKAFEDDSPMPIRKETDDRKTIRHLTDPKKYSACGVRWFRTTDASRVNCKSCMRTKAYKDAMKRREEAISDKNSEHVENARQEPEGVE